MSNRAILCIHAWTTPTIINKRDTVDIKYGTGNNTRNYELHVDALKARSGYFHESLPAFSKAERPTVRLMLSAPKPFDTFASWLYSDKLDNFDGFKLGYLSLCELYVLANALDIPLLRNKIIDVFFNKLLHEAQSLPYDIMKYIEENLRDSALRTMMQDIMLNCGEMKDVAEWEVNLANGFRTTGGGLGEKDVVEPFGRSSDVRGYLAELSGKVCERYHEHAERDERVVGHGEEWFFDPPLK